MSMPKISVIMRTFNRPAMLRRALESVGQQTWENREVLVINDGGSDVADVVAEFDGSLDVKYLNFTAENKPGRCGAANAGIEASVGEYIAYLDDDDIYYPEHLSRLMQRVETTGARCVYSFANVATEEPQEDGTYKVVDVAPGTYREFSRAAFFSSNFVHLSAFCHHRDLCDEQGLFDVDLEVLEDVDLFFRYSESAAFECVPEFTVQYHIRTDATNAITTMRDCWVETRNQLCQKYFSVAITEMMYYIDEGRASLQSVDAQVRALTERVAELEEQLTKLPQTDHQAPPS